MSQAFDEIAAGLQNAIEHAQQKNTNVIEHKSEIIDVKAIREQTGMTQQTFCATLGVSLTTLRHWERGLHSPRGTAKVLLKLIHQNPQIIM